VSARGYLLGLLAGLSAACAASDGCGSRRAHELSSASSVRWLEPLEVAQGRAHAGPWQMNESVFDYVDDATVALSDAGAVAVAWADNARKDVFFQMYGAAGVPSLREPTNVSQTPGMFSWLPRLVVDKDRVFALWQEIVFSGGSHGGDIYFSRSADAGRSFSAPLNLSRSIGGDGKGRVSRDQWDNGSLDLLRDRAGLLLAAWTEYEGALWFSRSKDDGASFTTPLRVGGSDDLPARGPSLARAPGHPLHVIWASGGRGSATLLLATSRDDGTSFDAPRPVVQSRGTVDAPKIAADPRGVLHLVYAERLHEAAPSRIRYLRLSDAARSGEASRTISDPTREAEATFPSLSLAASNSVAVVWLYRTTINAPFLGVELTVSRDAGAHFSPPELVPGTGDPSLGAIGSRQGKLMRLLAANPAGMLAVASSSYRDSQSSRIRVLRGHVR
jgi:hypothetical protein